MKIHINIEQLDKGYTVEINRYPEPREAPLFSRTKVYKETFVAVLEHLSGAKIE